MSIFVLPFMASFGFGVFFLTPAVLFAAFGVAAFEGALALEDFEARPFLDGEGADLAVVSDLALPVALVGTSFELLPAEPALPVVVGPASRSTDSAISSSSVSS